MGADFVKRVTPRGNWSGELMQGQHRRALRAHTNRLNRAGRLPSIEWGGGASVEVHDIDQDDLRATVDALPVAPEWLEHLDAVPWHFELLLRKLTCAVPKKKGAQWLGQRIAQTLQAHVAQTIGHSVLLYRPGLPTPVLDLERLMQDDKQRLQAKEERKTARRGEQQERKATNEAEDR